MKFLIFDIDGTLTNTTRVDDLCYIKAFKMAFDENINDVNWSDFKNVTDWGLTEELVKRRLKRKLKATELKLMQSTFFSLLHEEKTRDKSQFLEVPGAKYFLNYLKNIINTEIGIATGGWEESAKMKLEAIDVNPQELSFSNSNYFKSREDITRDVIAQMKVKTQTSPDEIIYFGDGIWDFHTCRKLNIRFIGIDHVKNGKLKRIGVDKVFHNFLDWNQINKEIKLDQI